jgi:predicted secreted acid phosphatase
MTENDYEQKYFEYQNSIDEVISNSMKSLGVPSIINKSINKPLVIFDIDDTLINTNNKLPNISVINLYNYVNNELKYNTVILTARKNISRDVTIKELDEIGINNYDEIIMKNNEYSTNSIYKYNKRKELSNKYYIVANVGDEYSDFFGGYNGLIIKIPKYISMP